MQDYRITYIHEIDFTFIAYETDQVTIVRMICTELDRLRFLQQAADGLLPIAGDQVLVKDDEGFEATRWRRC
jgi:hypothetical protein